MTKVFIDNSIDNILEKPIQDIAHLVESGSLEPLKAILVLKQLEKKAIEYKKRIEEIAIDELSKYEKSSTTIGSYTINLKKSAGRWDFKHIKEIVDAENKLKELKEKHKLAYNAEGKMLVEETGEVIEPANFKMGKEIIVISQNK